MWQRVKENIFLPVRFRLITRVINPVGRDHFRIHEVVVLQQTLELHHLGFAICWSGAGGKEGGVEGSSCGAMLLLVLWSLRVGKCDSKLRQVIVEISGGDGLFSGCG